MTGFLATLAILGLLSFSFFAFRFLYMAAKEPTKTTFGRKRREPKKPIAKISFEYLNADDESSKRTVLVTKINGLHVYGFCKLRNEYRTFSVERIANAFDAETGEIIENLSTYLQKSA